MLTFCDYQEQAEIREGIGGSVCPKKSESSSWGREVKVPGFYLRGWLVLVKRCAITMALFKGSLYPCPEE